MEKRSGAVTFAGGPVTLVGPEVKVGEKAPDFKLLDNSLAEKTLKDYEGKIKVISVVPSLDTGVCDAQTRWFNKDVTGLSSDVVVLTVSMDLPFAQARWCGAAGVKNVVTLLTIVMPPLGRTMASSWKDCVLKPVVLLSLIKMIRSPMWNTFQKSPMPLILMVSLLQ